MYGNVKHMAIILTRERRTYQTKKACRLTGYQTERE